MTMQIEPWPAFVVNTETTEYLRMGENNWFERTANSFEKVNSFLDLELQFREALRGSGKPDVYLG